MVTKSRMFPFHSHPPRPNRSSKFFVQCQMKAYIFLIIIPKFQLLIHFGNYSRKFTYFVFLMYSYGRDKERITLYQGWNRERYQRKRFQDPEPARKIKINPRQLESFLVTSYHPLLDFCCKASDFYDIGTRG